MKFLFIVQGEGRGHMSQAISMSHVLKSNGHDVVKVLIGKSKRRTIPEYFFEKIGAPSVTYESPNFVVGKDNKKIRLLPTILYNMIRGASYLKSLRFIHQQVKETKPDVIINFYEVMSGIYFFLYRPDVLHCCIGHQYMGLHPEFEFPKGRNMERWLFKTHTRITCLKSNILLGLSFSVHENIPHKNLYVIPPLLRDEILQATPEDKGYILAYILNQGYAKEIEEWHKKHPQTTIHLFGDAPFKEPSKVIHDNLIWHQINDVTFIQYLTQCSGYVSTAGFESVCEAMYLNKPVMMIPTGNHFEQASNALDASKTGAGIVGDSFNVSQLIEFIPKYQFNNAEYRQWVQSAGRSIPDILSRHISSES